MLRQERKFKLLQDVYVWHDGSFIKTYIVSTMLYKREATYLVAKIGKPIKEDLIFTPQEKKKFYG